MVDPIQEFAKLTVEERAYHLRVRTESERNLLLENWAESEYVSITDIFALPEEYQPHVMHFLVGNPTRGITGVGGSFTIEPVAGPVQLEIGSSRNKRRYVEISKPNVMDARRAAIAMSMYGPSSKKDVTRGKLREVLSQALIDLRTPEQENPKAFSDPKGGKK